ncbi:MAG: crotonase/enoyl-CoA hydratase family protein [Alphaproteobacteria bacterium]
MHSWEGAAREGEAENDRVVPLKSGIESARPASSAISATGHARQTARPLLASPVPWLQRHYENLEVEYDPRARALWYHMRPVDRPSFTPGLLRDIRLFQRTVVETFKAGSGPLPAQYLVLASRMNGVFNLGGDLRLLAQMIRARDAAGLQTYADACIAVLYPNAVDLDLPVVTISLVQGDALGGGFEAAISSKIVVAERCAKFGLPEVLFNLFPGMGAYSLLSRRIGPAAAERMILSGRIYTAAELYEMGIVDILAENGKGMEAVNDFIDRSDKRFDARLAVYRTRQCINPITFDELSAVARIWVETAMGRSESDLRRIDRLAQSQSKRWEQIHTEETLRIV